VSEIISDGENGYLIRPDDSKTLAKRLSILKNDRELLARLSLNALRRYRQQPTWEETAGRIQDFLQEIVGVNSRPPLRGK
jgi:glycosyltransferase involved in cell wall biosynthesis